MSEEEPVERRRDVAQSGQTSQTTALASSVPDDNHMLMRMLRFLLRPPQGFRWAMPITSIGGVVIILVYVIAKWGVPAILAMQTLILQLHEDQTSLATADKQIQREQVTATQDVLAALQGIGAKLDTQGVKIDVQGRKLDAQGQQIEELSRDVGTLKQAQASTDRRVGSIASSQAQLRDRLNKAP